MKASCWPTLAVVLSLAQSAAAQTTAAPPPGVAPAPAQVAPPGQPAVVQAPPPAPGTVQYGQPAPAPAPGTAAPPPYYGQQPYYAQQPPVYTPQPAYAPPPPRYRPRRGLMISGIAVLGASYIVSAISGGVLMDIERGTCDQCKDVGPWLLIPLAGPFIAIPEADSGKAFLVLLGVLQVAGTAMTVGGVVQYNMHKKRAAQGMYGLELGEGRSLAFDLSASPWRLGPTAQLRF